MEFEGGIMYTLPTQTSVQVGNPYEFRFEGLSNFSTSVEGLVQIDINPRI